MKAFRRSSKKTGKKKPYVAKQNRTDTGDNGSVGKQKPCCNLQGIKKIRRLFRSIKTAPWQLPGSFKR